MLHTPVAYPFADFLVNPQTSWARFFNPQLFISVNSSDALIENHVLGRAGSYGKQLGILLDLVEVLTARLPTDELTPTERRAVDAFTELRDDVESAKAGFRGEPASARARISRADVERFLDQLADLARTDPRAHRAMVDRLREALGPEDSSE